MGVNCCSRRYHGRYCSYRCDHSHRRHNRIVVLGADSDGISWDCWKPLFHDTSSAPSNGMPLAEALSHPDIHVVPDEVEGLVVQNAWSERFLISPVMLPCGRLAAHASKMES